MDLAFFVYRDRHRKGAVPVKNLSVWSNDDESLKWRIVADSFGAFVVVAKFISLKGRV